MRPATLCPDPSLWRVDWVEVGEERIVLHLRPVRTLVPCPLCGVNSRRVHSLYWRKVWDSPWFNWPVQLVIRTRKFFCDTPECRRRIFTEPFPKVLARYGRQTQRTRDSLLELAHCSNAEMAAKVARLLGFVTSPDTLIRQQRQEQFSLPVPRALGVDDFALRKGRTYGTLLVDLERHRPIDLLEGAKAEPLIHWLKPRSQVSVLARDRAGAYALAGHIGAPQALQVADRFHLVRNVSDALKDLVRSRRWNYRAPVAPDEKACSAPTTPPLQEQQTTPLKQARWEAVQEQRLKGLPIRGIARVLGISRSTVRNYSASDRPPAYSPRRPQPTKLTPYLEYLRQRWAEGCHNARQLHLELVQRGYQGSESQLRATLGPWRSSKPSAPTERAPPLHWLVLPPRERLTATQCAQLETYLNANLALARGYQLKERFLDLMRQRDVGALDVWIRDAQSSGLATFQTTARSFLHDYAAIQAALTTPWSTGQCEGQICRLKLIKRVGYGRAKPDLLRQRVLHRLAG